MKTLANLFIVIGIGCYLVALMSKFTGGVLYVANTKPVAALVFGNSCMLISLVVMNLIKK